MKIKKLFAIALASAMAMTSATVWAAEATETPDLSGQELMVFSGGGLKEPVQEIADAFKEKTGCDVQIVFAATGQLIAQIQTTESGDLLIPGSKDELKLMEEDEVTEAVDLVKHIPIVAVQKGNPLNVESIKDLGAEGLTVLFPDPETAPVGKIAVKAFEEAGIIDSIDIVANTSTAPLALTALAEQEADAAIVWKENASKNENVEILELPEMEKHIKVISAASLKYSANEEAQAAFVEFMSGEAGMEIWQAHGYELVAE